MSSETTVIVLAGGASTRMKRPKALLAFGDETLIERVVCRLAPLANRTIVVSAAHVPLPALPRGVRVVEDTIPLLGPAAGILHGLRATETDLSFVCSCDQPFPSVALGRLLVEHAKESDLVIPRWHGRLQPLFAVYRRSLLPHFEREIGRGERRLLSLVAGASPREVPEKEIAAVDPEGRSFFDVDTPGKYRAALRIAAGE
ncbi:MAG: molybdenum cofactor guanylyltransferase [Candidatus Binatia bacterium]